MIIAGLSRCALFCATQICFVNADADGALKALEFWSSRSSRSSLKLQIKSWTKRSLGPSSKMSRWLYNCLGQICLAKLVECHLQRIFGIEIQVVAKMEDLGVTLPLQELERVGPVGTLVQVHPFFLYA